MEPLIVALILLAVGAFFNNKKKSEGDSSPRSSPETDRQQGSKSRNQGGFKRMEDYAKEIYGEFQAQMNPEADKKEQVKEAAKQVVERQTNRKPVRKAASAAVEQTGGRLSAHQKQAQPVRKTAHQESNNPFPLSQSEAQKAIILAEVFMPPKSKRR